MHQEKKEPRWPGTGVRVQQGERSTHSPGGAGALAQGTEGGGARWGTEARVRRMSV